MPGIESLSMDLIKRALKLKGIKFVIDQDDDFRITYGKDDSHPEMTVFATSAGGKKEILSVRSYVFDVEIQKNKWPKAILACNEWHKEHYWPTVYLHQKDNETGLIVGQAYLDCEVGVSVELVADFIATIVASTAGFWKWAIKENKL